jgi:hypothetical protein
MDFKEQLGKQLRFLQTSCERYDAGDKDESIRIAQSLRVIFHNTRHSTSLLSHLGRTGLRLLSTSVDIPHGAGYWANLTKITLSPVLELAEYVPKLDTTDHRRWVNLTEWWRNEFVYLVGSMVITRRELVLGAANTDGGAHVADSYGFKYEKILEGAGWKMTLNPDNGASKELTFKYGHLAALRQMGYEVLNSPDLLLLA